MGPKISWAQRVGNIVSTILLGQTKEIIIRTGQRVGAIEQRMGVIEHDLKDVRERLATLEGRLAPRIAQK